MVNGGAIVNHRFAVLRDIVIVAFRSFHLGRGDAFFAVNLR
jgi:hypothetical protein